MPLDFNINLTDDTMDTVESGGQVEPGWYLAELKDVYDDDRNPTTTVFQYTVLEGKYAQKSVWDRLADPGQAESQSAAQFLAQRLKLLAKRLGLIGKEHEGKQVSGSWYGAIKKRFLLHIARRAYTDKKTGEQKEQVGVTFDGVYPLDYDQSKLPKGFPDELRKHFTSPPPPVAAGGSAPPGAPAGPRQPPVKLADFSDL